MSDVPTRDRSTSAGPTSAGPARATKHKTGRKLHWGDHVFGAALCLVYVALLLATAGDLAMSRDESFYVTAAESYAPWFELLFSDPSAALTTGAVDRFWSYNHEHPGLIKSLFALSWIAQQHFGIFDEPTQAFRVVGMLSAGLLLWLTYVFGTRASGRRVGLFAALSLALLPRVFYHAHLDCFDLPIVLMITWTVYCYWRSLEDRRWAIWTGIAFGCALGTKHNSWAVPLILGVHFAWVVFNERTHRKSGGERRLSYVPYWLLGMLLIGPWIFYGSWPWMWHTTLPRIAAYIGFHTKHDYYHMVYFGKTYFQPPFPVSFPFVMTAFTLPATTLVLGVLGIATRLRALVPTALLSRLWPRGILGADPRATDVLFAGCALAPLVMIALPSTPIFGGTKHWFPGYPFLCLFAGYGASRVLAAAQGFLSERSLVSRNWLLPSVYGVLLLPGLAETAHSHPYALSHYTMPAGGVPGAADLGMNRQFWGFTTGSVVGFLREAMPRGGSVYIHDTTWKAWEMLQRDGQLPRNIRPARQLSEADYVLVHFEEHMVEVDFQAWQSFGSVQPVHVLHYDGVPLVTVYESPRHRRRKRP